MTILEFNSIVRGQRVVLPGIGRGVVEAVYYQGSIPELRVDIAWSDGLVVPNLEYQDIAEAIV